MSKPARLHVLVRGKVQGVFFRHQTQQIAESLSITGWVRNNSDGSMEACLEGERESLEKMEDWFRTGPKYALVRECHVSWETYQGSFSYFEVH